MNELSDRWYYYLKKTNPDFNNMGMDQQGEIIASLAETNVEPIIPDRFEIVFRIRWYHVYGFEKDSTEGHSYGKFHYKSGAEARLKELEKIFHINDK